MGEEKQGRKKSREKNKERGKRGGIQERTDRKEETKKGKQRSSLGRYVFGSEISYNKAPPRLPGLAC